MVFTQVQLVPRPTFNVLANDTDPNAGDTLSVTLIDGR